MTFQSLELMAPSLKDGNITADLHVSKIFNIVLN